MIKKRINKENINARKHVLHTSQDSQYARRATPRITSTRASRVLGIVTTLQDHGLPSHIIHQTSYTVNRAHLLPFPHSTQVVPRILHGFIVLEKPEEKKLRGGRKMVTILKYSCVTTLSVYS